MMMHDFLSITSFLKKISQYSTIFWLSKGFYYQAEELGNVGLSPAATCNMTHAAESEHDETVKHLKSTNRDAKLEN